MNPKDDPEFELITFCWTCGSTVEIIHDSNYPDRQFTVCHTCSEALDKLDDITSLKDEAIMRYNEMEKRYNKIAETISNIRFALH
jgi:hypothetical protein